MWRTRYHEAMQVMTGCVVAGKIEVETDLQEGTPVIVLIADETGLELTQEQQDEISASVREIRDGLYEDGDDLLAELRSKHRR